MWIDFTLLFLLLNNISIFVVMVVGYSFLIDWLRGAEPIARSACLGLFFGLIVFISMQVKIPAADGVVIDQRNAIVVLSGAFGGPICAIVTGLLASAFRAYIGGIGTVAGIFGVCLSVLAGIALHRFGWHRRGALNLAAAAALAVVFTAPGFLLVGDLQTGWELLKRMAVPWGTAIFVGIFLGGLLLQREDRRQKIELDKQRTEDQYRALFMSSEVPIWNQDYSRIHDRLQQLRAIGVTDLRAYVDRNPDLLDELAALSRITLVNDATLRLYGLDSTAEFIASQSRLMRCAESSVFADQMYAIWNGDQAFRSEDTHSTHDGRELTVILSMPIPSRAEDFASIPVSVLDISDRKKAERARDDAVEQATRANQAKSDFLAAMSHELRTPLNAVLGFSEILTSETFGPLGNDRYVEYARHIHSSGGMLLDLVNDLLDISTIEAGRRDLEIAPVAVQDLVADSLSVVDQRARSVGIEIRTHLPDIPLILHVDRRAIQQVLINLLTNSVKYTDAGGTLTIRSGGDGAVTDIIVSDTGVGIPRDRLEEVMNPFVRGERDPHKAQGGWGLGLSIARSLVEMHGGTLIIDSAVGWGTSVTVRLPGGAGMQTPVPTDMSLTAAR